jgi:hypothetical protein
MKLSVLFVFEKRISSHVRKSKVSFGLSATAVLFLSCSFGLFCIVFVWLILAYQQPANSTFLSEKTNHQHEQLLM